MIYIISEYVDPSTNHVIEWLRFYKVEFKRFNFFEEIFSNENFSIEIKSNPSISFTTTKNDCIWFRRSPQNIVNNLLKNEFKNNKELNTIEHIINTVSAKESKSVFDSFFNKIRRGKHFSLGFYSRDFSKIEQLTLAEKCGLSIPMTSIINNKKDLICFYKQNDSIIIKPLTEISFIYYSEKVLIPYTTKIDIDFINNLPDNFHPCLVQKCIQKEFEIRTFVMDGLLYSMAIFSQQNKQTEIDFRRYDIDNPNRRVPFKLPIEIENKILKFMNLANLNTGSIDIIYNNEDYYFLEINPVGQFGMVSAPCRYNLEEKIANLLIKKQNEQSN